jgi:hypothetical protein
MRCELVTIKNLPEVVLHEVSADDKVRINKAIENFRAATRHNNKTFCNLLSDNFRSNRIGTDVLERLSVWCHTDMGPHGVSNAAQALSSELLGIVPPRLRERNKKRGKDYKDHVKWLAAMIA